MKSEINNKNKKMNLFNIKQRIGRFILGGLVSVTLFSGFKELKLIITGEEQITIVNDNEEVPIVKEENGQTFVYIGENFKNNYINRHYNDDWYVSDNIDDQGYILLDKLKDVKRLTVGVSVFENLDWLNYCDNIEELYLYDHDYVDYSKLNCLKGFDKLKRLYINGYNRNASNDRTITSIIQVENLEFVKFCPKLEFFSLDTRVDISVLEYFTNEFFENISLSPEIFDATNMKIYDGTINTELIIYLDSDKAILKANCLNNILKEDKENLQPKIFNFINNVIGNGRDQLNLNLPTIQYRDNAYLTFECLNNPIFEQIEFNSCIISSNGGDFSHDDLILLNKLPYKIRKEVSVDNFYTLKLLNNIDIDIDSIHLPYFKNTSYQAKQFYENIIQYIENGDINNILPLIETKEVEDVDLLSVLSLDQIIYLRDNGIIKVEDDIFNKMIKTENRLQDIIKELNLPENASDSEKLDAIGKYICEKYYYEDISTGKQVDDEYHYGKLSIIVDYNNIVCRHYATLTTALANRVGLECYNVDSIDHEWNFIKIDSGYCYTDQTWVDTGLFDIRNLKWHLIPAEQYIGADGSHQIEDDIILPNDLQKYQFVEVNEDVTYPYDYSNILKAFTIGGITISKMDQLKNKKQKKLTRKL